MQVYEREELKDIIHEFLIQICSRDSGIAFPDQGWYPVISQEGEESSRLNNELFLRIMTLLKPLTERLHQDLVHHIINNFPELSRPYSIV